MTKHSKNNTASSIFSYAEYKKLDYGTKRQRLGNESMRQFDACSLCLQRARDPLSCSSGHLFCKECVYNDLLTQKKDIKRQKERIEALRVEEEEDKERAKEAARQRVLRDFENGQLGLSTTRPMDSGKTGSSANQEEGKTKRKFDFDQDKVEIMAREAEEAALRQIEREQAESRKSKLPDFWLPSLTPTAMAGKLKDVKISTTCKAARPPHLLSYVDFTHIIKSKCDLPYQLSLKDLIPVTFASSDDGKTSSNSSSDESTKVCPSCRKTLSNNILLNLMKPCSHVLCKTCADSLVQPAEQCVVCDTKLKKTDIIELKREGRTGYAGGGIAETSKKGIAFQG
ncbi:hypothetical protein BU17DRAFT_51919 [Hysterangium stoloniferum]|nr:hypothetical protein BU17DRAFT_51919 [Hysterangium stoloniferum]